jgi:hypothetical protein
VVQWWCSVEEGVVVKQRHDDEGFARAADGGRLAEERAEADDEQLEGRRRSPGSSSG